MSLTTAEITDLLRRAQLSEARGYSIARADFYAQALGGSDGSPASLAALCRAALRDGGDTPEETPKLTEGGGASKKPKALPEEGTAQRTESASPEPPPEPEEPELEEPEPAAEAPEEEAHDDSAEAYESWSKKKLLTTAQERGLGVNAHNTKAEIIEALRSAD